MDDEYDYCFRLALIGDSGVGKSNIKSRIARNEFNVESTSTVGVDFATKMLEIDNHIVKIQIWDTAGVERSKIIFSAYCNNVAGIFLVYDVTSRSSFENVRHRWLKKLRESADPTAVILLVGNKVDLGESSREVETEEGRSLAEEEGLLFIETSALDATNIDAAFTTFLDKLCSNLPKKPKATPKSTDNQKTYSVKIPSCSRFVFS